MLTYKEFTKQAKKLKKTSSDVKIEILGQSVSIVADGQAFALYSDKDPEFREAQKKKFDAWLKKN